MSELADKIERVNRFKEFVRSHGYELNVSDSGVSIEELLKPLKSVCGSRADELDLTDEIVKEVSKNVGTDD